MSCVAGSWHATKLARRHWLTSLGPANLFLPLLCLMNISSSKNFPAILRSVLVATALFLTAQSPAFGQTSTAEAGQNPHPKKEGFVLKAAARTFSVTPKVGTAAMSSHTATGLTEVIGDLKNTLILFEYGPTRLCFLTSPLGIQGGQP